jgi:hypothetical protein
MLDSLIAREIATRCCHAILENLDLESASSLIGVLPDSCLYATTLSDSGSDPSGVYHVMSVDLP